MNFKLRPLILLLITLISISNRSTAQNYVPNWSFELIDSCPPGHTYGNNDWVVQNWDVPNGSVTTPDLFSTCYNGTIPIFPYEDISVPQNFMGYAFPKTGENYVGFLLKYGSNTGGENVQTQLVAPLVAGQKYLCGFHVQRADSSYYQIDKVGMHISTVPEFQNGNQTMSNLMPQIENNTGIMYDSLNWLNVEGIYIATGGEQYITIGNFYSNSDTNSDSIDVNQNGTLFWFKRGYYYLDDVYIFPYDENLSANFPDQVCSGKTITLSVNGSAKYDWYIDGIWYSSDSIISFIAEESVQISVAGYEDSLSHFIEVIDCPIDCSGEPIFPNVFTPNNDNINDLFFPREINAGCYTITILNRWGNVMCEGSRDYYFWDGNSQNGERVSEGVYFYIVEVEDNLGVKRKYHGHLTVSR